MKMMYAATPEQEHHMQYLLNYFYTDVFPYYFDDEQIRQFEEWGILSLDHEHVAYNGTMKEAFQIISALQSLITVIEYMGEHGECDQYEWLFARNQNILARHGITFPFRAKQFIHKRAMPCSMYVPAVNQWVM
ncbi:YhcU family protein [Geobacillus stearothermophilus]|uniref:YhcU family protein n=1 Tax=Geobacillus stearothermophilus TaxID=1422 RepID=UPI002E245EE3|nr:YhcU family protein [Geobacillus stearothermophilus]MED3756707.1 YhcU family protein [Geobacillus stearothermophilus]